MKVTAGFNDGERALIASMYWAAFGQKLGKIMGPDARAKMFFTEILDSDHALCARDADGQLLGVAGFKTHKGALAGGTRQDLARYYGWLGSTWRLAVLAFLERDTENKRFLMDGIFVRQAARGQGVGTALLDAICTEAKTRGFEEVRLDVADTNPRAKALYLRLGFEAGKVHHLGLLKHVFGFQSATAMIRRV